MQSDKEQDLLELNAEERLALADLWAEPSQRMAVVKMLTSRQITAQEQALQAASRGEVAKAAFEAGKKASLKSLMLDIETIVKETNENEKR